MRVLLIDGGEVANIANFDDDHVLVEGQILADDFPFAEIGSAVVDGTPIALPPPSVPLADTKASAKRQMVAWIDQLTDQLRSGIPRDEVASWPAKAAEARAVLAGSTDALILQVEADLVGLTLTEVAETISARAVLYETVVGAVAGIRRNTVAAIDAATDAGGVALALDEALATATAKATELGLVVAG
ncbi:hypothetical protein [Loktanella salsilacus]|uniref:hypothetical protein n=1 Tax=Loktanella salsilacus TaxID=195913 RepID=UPI003704BBA6